MVDRIMEMEHNQRSETTALARIVAPISTEVFFDEYFEAQPLLVARNDADHFAGLLSLEHVDRIIATLDLRWPDISLINAARKIEPDEYIRQGDVVDVAQIFSLHADGATIILNHLHTLHSPLADFCAALELEFSCPIQSNVYVTPPDAKGFKAHFDTHDVFILQVHGSKRWRLYGTPIELPTRGQGDEASQDSPCAPTKEFVLNSGDTLYIPRGLVHDAMSCNDTSVHVTVGVLSYTWTDALLEALAAVCLNDPTFRRSLPRGLARGDYDYEPARKMFQSFIERFALSVDPQAALKTFVDNFIESRRPRLLGQMMHLSALKTLSLLDVVALRSHLAYSVREDDAGIHVCIYGKEIRFPNSASAALRYALAKRRFKIADLPNNLDDESKLVFVRRLVREGVLAVVGAEPQSAPAIT